MHTIQRKRNWVKEEVIMKKRLFALLTVAAVALTAIGCGSNGGSTASSAASSAAGSSAASTTAAGKKYIIATDTAFAPFEYQETDGKYVGIDMDILEAVAKDQGFEYEINALGFDASLQAVQGGQADGVIAGMSITDKRKEVFDFSESYYNVPVTIAVKADSKIEKLDDLKDQKVAVKKGTTGATVAEEIKDKVGIKEIVVFDDSATMYQEVAVGTSVACFEDYPVMAYAIKVNPELTSKIKVVESVAEKETPYGFAVKKGANAELLDKFNKGLANIKKNGVFDEIIKKYTK